MALVRTTNCINCRQEFSAVNNQIKCNVCLAIDEKIKRKEHFAKLDELTVEERLRIVEEWIYDYSPPKDPYNTTY